MGMTLDKMLKCWDIYMQIYKSGYWSLLSVALSDLVLFLKSYTSGEIMFVKDIFSFMDDNCLDESGSGKWRETLQLTVKAKSIVFFVGHIIYLNLNNNTFNFVQIFSRLLINCLDYC